MTVYGLIISNGDVILTNGTSGKPIAFADAPTSIPDGYTTSMRWQEFDDRIQQVYDIVPEQGSAAEAATRLVKHYAQTLDDDDALDYIALFDSYVVIGKKYYVGDRFVYNGDLWKAMKEFISNGEFTIPGTVSEDVIAKVVKSIPEWDKPMSEDVGYSIGEKVMHNGVEYESIANNNVFEPGVEGYEKYWKIVA